MRIQKRLIQHVAVFFAFLLSTFTSFSQGFDPCSPPGPGCSAGPAVMMFSPHCGDTLSALQPDTLFVGAMDVNGKIDTTFNGPLTLTVNNGPGTMNGNLNMAFNKGLAVFMGITVTAPGLYDVTFGGGTLPALNCQIMFDTTFGNPGGPGSGPCTGGGPSVGLMFTNYPQNVGVNGPFNVEVSAMNAGNCTDTTYTGLITITKMAGPGNVGGTLSANANKGVAVFNNVTVDMAGAYVLQASAAGLPNANSSNINANGGSGGGPGGGCPPTSTAGARTNMGLYGGSSLDLTFNYTNRRLFAAISSPASLFYTDDTCKTWSRAFPDDSLEYGCGRGWGGRAVRVLTNQNNWVAVQTSQEAGTLNALVISYDGGTTWTTAMDGWMMNQLGFQGMGNVSGMTLTDYYMFCLMGKRIVKVSNAGPVNPSTDVVDITAAIAGMNSNATVKGIAAGNNSNGYPYYILVDSTGQFGNNPCDIYRYDGTTFTRITLPMGVTGATSIFTHPNQANADTLFFVSGGGQIYRSLNGGTSWTQLTAPATNFMLSDVDYSPDWVSSMPLSNGMIMIIPGVAMSMDMGDNWTTIGLQNNGGAVHPTTPNIVVGTMGRGVVVSTTGPAGPYSIAPNYGLEAVTIKKISRTASKSVFYLATRAGLAYTTAYTNTAVAGYDKWNTPYGQFPVPNVGDDAGISAVAIDPEDSLHVIAGYSNGFALTTTGVSGFANVQPAGWNAAGADPAVNDILFVNTTTVLAVTGGDNQSASGKGNIWRTTDGGTTWTKVSPTGFTCGNSLAKGSVNGNNVIYCGTGLSGSMADPGTLWKSTDDGATWTMVTYGPTASNNPSVSQLPIYDVAVDPRGTDTLYLACGSNLDYAFVKSTNGGSTFSAVNAGGEGAFTSVCINQTYPDSVYMAIRRDILVYDAATDSVMYIYRGLPGELVPDLAFGSVLAGTSMGFFKVEATPFNTTGISQATLQEAGDLMIYPNPVHDEATIVFKSSKRSEVTIKVFDIMGNLVWTAPVQSSGMESQRVTMNTTELSSGTYCVRMQSQDGTVVRRFIRIN
ncbi:MAG: T9SS type A sorting domain-containing protein [Bacteroidia bacterium]